VKFKEKYDLTKRADSGTSLCRSIQKMLNDEKTAFKKNKRMVFPPDRKLGEPK